MFKQFKSFKEPKAQSAQKLGKGRKSFYDLKETLKVQGSVFNVEHGTALC